MSIGLFVTFFWGGGGWWGVENFEVLELTYQ